MSKMTKQDFLDKLAMDIFGWNGDPSCCRRCSEKVGKFKDELSEKEYKLTGWCQKCQDGYYEEED